MHSYFGKVHLLFEVARSNLENFKNVVTNGKCDILYLAGYVKQRERQANINIADGRKSSVILQSEAAKLDQVNRAQGEAEAILAKAQATAKGITLVSQTLKENGGVEAASLRIAEQYLQAFSMIAKKGTTMLLPASASNPANMMAQALSIYKNLIGNGSGNGIPDIPGAESIDNTKNDTPSRESGDDEKQTSVESVFSLQSPKKDN
ncbi:stomatin-like protein 2, mitochondrial [Olea europaea var. sylvestris]|uniref:stomatin-like protein 2, mitochondrial n=1 Tax=Olea europaea var. sylvestris TaxID=158386 RepID=UPI000C1D2046|nr:stomatin-like protein 2, mitochondrial [Olea europaea var. sylvestris]